MDLKNKKIFYLDDTKGELEFFGKEFSKLTENITLFHYKNESVEELVQKIISKKPDIVFLDYNLSLTLRGSEVCRKLRENKFSGKIIGFSTVMVRDLFTEAGADGFILKDDYNPKSVIEELK